MQSYLSYSTSELEKNRALFTAREISTQPIVWEKTYFSFQEKKNAIDFFIKGIFGKEELNVILTGAGTSAFIGEMLQGPFQMQSKCSTRAVATTDLVTHPQLYIHPDKPTLLVSFARSGNSPESVKAVELANALSPEIYHFVITCNPDGKLAQMAKGDNAYVFLLPKEADDQSLAMTSSFTSMSLAGLLLASGATPVNFDNDIKLLTAYAQKILDVYLPQLKNVGSMAFERAVFLGSGLFGGIARESHLKLQELTDGKVICKHDSFLGFRHGPKAVIDEKTLLVFHFSNDNYVQQYEIDLVRDVNAGQKGLYRIGIMESDLDVDVDLKIILDGADTKITEPFLALVSVLPAQIIGFFKSMNLGLHPDAPSVSGTITRVVQGVKLYPYLVQEKSEE